MATGMVKQRPAGAHAAIVEQVRAEAEHLPGPAPAWYGQLRRLYWLRRMEALGRKGDNTELPVETLVRCLRELGKSWTDLPGQLWHEWNVNPKLGGD